MCRWASINKLSPRTTAWAELSTGAAGAFATEWMQQPASDLASSDAKVVIEARALKEGMAGSKTMLESPNETLVSSVLQLERATEHIVEQDNDLNIHIKAGGADESDQRARYRWCRMGGSGAAEWQSLTPAKAPGLVGELIESERQRQNTPLASSERGVGLQIRAEAHGKIASGHKRGATIQKATAPISPQPTVIQSEDGFISIVCDSETAQCFCQWGQDGPAPPSDGWRPFANSEGLQPEFKASFGVSGAKRPRVVASSGRVFSAPPQTVLQPQPRSAGADQSRLPGDGSG